MGERRIGEEWEAIEKKMREAKGTERELGNREARRGGWWDNKCMEEKRELKRASRDWRREVGEGREYKERKRKYKETNKRKKKEENKRWEKKAAVAKKESEVWEIVNRE